MTGECVTAGLSPSLAIEALRLIRDIFSTLEIAADNGRQLLCAFIASPELHDRICVFGASIEDDEDDGLDEACHRDAPLERPARRAALPAPLPPVLPLPMRGALLPYAPPGLMTPTMMRAHQPPIPQPAYRLPEVFAAALMLPPEVTEADGVDLVGAREQGRAKLPRRPAGRIGDAPRTSPPEPAAGEGRDAIAMTRDRNESQVPKLEYT